MFLLLGKPQKNPCWTRLRYRNNTFVFYVATRIKQMKSY